jgi:Icc protein
VPTRAARILHLTDPHLHASPETRMRGVRTDETLQRVIADAMQNHDRPDCLLVTGDIVQDESRAGYQRFREIAAVPGLPVYCLPGNHDAPGMLAEVCNDGNFQFCGTASFGPWHLIMLDTVVAGDDGGALRPSELARLERFLSALSGQHALIALHHQPVPMGSRWLDAVGLSNAADLLRIVGRHDVVRAILWGHVHQASDRMHGSIRLLSTPSTCAQFLPGAVEFALDTRPPGYRWLDLYADGSITTQLAWTE